ncbi:venom protease-like [Daktulosphaira vitifoliae]|uniref:venom protease-like n=1 Tax=Daktulosphaira vitifoliae TaxID=58002 RepID=UPI0021A9959F|nr:venom protease-like [Daktulosphaira vitifoliae]XP_050544570.1 venom protease-like [Daktulosphaira vitifoliae]XP_050544571.1 venom protease-like [Daktulosphaira vitifoliae]
MESILHVTWLIFLLKAVNTQVNSDCFTPNDENGVCVNIKRCPHLLNLLESQRRNSTVVAFLRNSMCGYEGRDPKVCCGLDNENANNNVNMNSNNGNDDNFGSSTRPTRPGTTQRPTTSSYSETVISSKLPLLNSCGRSNATQNRIVGGQPADLDDWPWIAALGYVSSNSRQNSNSPQWLCGGTLIADRYVITAAHCTVGIGQRRLAIAHLGDLDLNPNVRDGAGPVDVPVERVMTHENYNAQDYTNDIALLKLDRSVGFNRHIQPICLPISSELRANRFVKKMPFVAGWGATSFRGPSSTALMEVQVPVVENADCKRSYVNKKTVIDDRVLCAGYSTGGRDACQGDSGGPLMWLSGNQYYLIGVVSFGFKCAEPGFPGVYTRVTHFVDWIAERMNNS